MSVQSSRRIGAALLCVFVASGFAGLVYQSVWSHYLGLVLGHAAYAQSLVLAIFMGGMSLGAWIASRRSLRWTSVIRAYAVVELVVGLIGLVFHPLFVAYVDVSQQTVLPAIESDWLAHLYQWTSSAALIAPQCILLGMTFPLISAGYLRLAPGEDGRVLGGLYFTNSIGAAAGALVCTFLLLPAIGMPGAVLTAGVLNLAVGAVSWRLGGIASSMTTSADAEDPALPASESNVRLPRLLLTAAFITGATSFVYEIGWVRLLNQALGTTVHSFELMLAAFIAGLAFGGYWVRRRSAAIADVVAYAGYAQVLMGVAALLSLPLFAHSFLWVEWLMQALARTPQGYTIYSFGSAAVALAVMFPAAFFAGMTLPLFTVALLRNGSGESSIGRVYALNTLGAIVGVFAMMHLLIPAIGIHLGLVLAAVVDVLLGLYLLRVVAASVRRRAYLAVAVVAVVAVVAGLVWGRAKPEVQIAGVFRTGTTALDGLKKVAYLRDGKTSTIGVARFDEGFSTIATNGKPDAGLTDSLSQPPTADEITMVMAGALPLYLNPAARDIAVIGWGSGLTVHTILGSDVPRRVEAIEIERTMHEGARLFGQRVERAYSDPRLNVVFDDARTYFATRSRHYDVIVSEPSNPWVSGVASLFTREFYGFARRHLNPNGLLVQWLQAYEIDDRLLATMVSALIETFPYVDAYIVNNSDMLFVAGMAPPVHPDWTPLSTPSLQYELGRVGLKGPAEVSLRRIGDRRTLAAFVRLVGATPHSDFFPAVSLQGPRSRFIGQGSMLLQTQVQSGLPVLDLLGVRQPVRRADNVQIAKASFLARNYSQAERVADALQHGNSNELAAHSPALAADVSLLLEPYDPGRIETWTKAAGNVAAVTLGVLSAEDLDGVWIDAAWQRSAATSDAAATILQAYAAAAKRDAVQTRRLAEQALKLPNGDIAPVTREQMLVLAMAGAIGDGKPGDAAVLERRYGASIPASADLGRVRAFLLAWVDGD